MRRLERIRLRSDVTAGVVAHMAAIARRSLGATGFCTNDQFRAAGFSAAAIRKHGDRARHRAALAMSRGTGDHAGGNHRGERE